MFRAAVPQDEPNWTKRRWPCPSCSWIGLALVNLALLGFAAVNAPGMRPNTGRGWARRSPGEPARCSLRSAALSRKVNAVRVGSYTVSVSGGGRPGARIEVAVTYRVPGCFGGLASLFRASTPSNVPGAGAAHTAVRRAGDVF